MIKIGKPYLSETENGATRLCAIVNYDGKDEEIWYEVEQEFSKYLCFERADAFLLAFLPYAMAFKHDIEISAPISERLFYQLTNYYIPALSKFSNYYSLIKIIPESLDSTNYVVGNGVGTGFSAGVDSFYSVCKHLENREESFRLTHLTFFKVGATGSYGGEKADETFRHRVEKFRSFGAKRGLKFVTVDSNVSEHARMSFNYIHTFRSVSAVLALQKLFGKYYYSAGETVGSFKINPIASSYFDIFNLENFAVEGMTLYSTGCDCERTEKQEYISHFEDSYDLLNVCNSEAENCCRCEKCIRTMAAFYSLGVLDKYKNAFDLDYFYNNFSSCMALLIGKKFDGTVEGNLDAILVKDIKKSGRKIPFSAYIKAIPVAFKAFAYRVARKIKPIRKWYHKKMHDELGCNYNDG
ncbi:MAG: hypothetical protein MJ090_04435 [Clostridia bacterium]|nr:hypothetical protein [Clostridia bacterium]